jgi:hypothetical protein
LVESWDTEISGGKATPSRHALDVLVLDESTKSLQGCVPLCGNLIEIFANFGQLPSLDLPQSISPDTLALHKSGILEHPQVLGHGLT